ncbi:MAG: SDR family oxidoreductase [Caldilineaceae bacterium]|nr:SDR family oxidoreductase [Caldilineaceae bacterium]MCL4835985.1 SDR family oxidoreductase [Caldilineaceae bacterium]
MTERTLPQLLDLSGRVAIVTGAAGWLGSAMSRALAEAGATLVVTSREAERAQGFADSLPGHGHIGLALSQEETEQIPGFVADVVNRLGRVDVLVNNAYGTTAPSIDSASAEDFDRAYHAGVTAYFLLAREVVHHLHTRGAPGSVINIASMYGVVASYPDAYTDLPVNSPPNYHGLKGGLIHLTRHLAVYWAKDRVRVNAISPGAFPSPRVRKSMPDFVGRLNQKVPLGRMGEPEELKGLVVLLASDAGSYITGQNILVDGGWTAW